MKIAIIGAMAIEVEGLRGKMENVTEEHISGTVYYSGMLFGREVVLAMCGIGKVAAAVCAQTMLLHFGATHVINTGIGGTLCSELSILDIAISDGVVEHDMDTSPIGDPVGLISGIDKIVVPTSERLARAALIAADSLGYNSKCGVIASGDQFIASGERKKFIVDNFDAICCEMEGAAIGHVCYLWKRECVIVRAISDSATGEAEMEYPEMSARAAERSQKIIRKMFELL